MTETFPAAAKEIERLLAEGYFVVILPNCTAPGTAALAREITAHLAAADQDLVSIAADAGGSPADRDMAMRRLFYFTSFADLVVTVEGWMMHTAFSLGKPYRVMMAPHSHDFRWHPRYRSSAQDVVLPAGRSGPPIVEQPRKAVFLFLLRDSGTLPMARQALASPDRDIRVAGAEALAKFPGHSITSELAGLLRDRWYRVRGRRLKGYCSARTRASRKPNW